MKYSGEIHDFCPFYGGGGGCRGAGGGVWGNFFSNFCL